MLWQQRSLATSLLSGCIHTVTSPGRQLLFRRLTEATWWWSSLTLQGWQSGQGWKQYILEQNSAVDSWGAQQVRSNTQFLYNFYKTFTFSLITTHVLIRNIGSKGALLPGLWCKFSSSGSCFQIHLFQQGTVEVAFSWAFVTLPYLGCKSILAPCCLEESQ